jgi:hypothetical protein
MALWPERDIFFFDKPRQSRIFLLSIELIYIEIHSFLWLDALLISKIQAEKG